MNRRAFLQSAVLASVSLAVPLAAPIPAAAFGGNLRLVLDAICEPHSRLIWVSGPARSGKTLIAQSLDNMLRTLGPTFLLSPHYEFSTIRMLRGRCYQHVIIDDHELFSCAEGDIARLANQRAITYRHGKVIVFSREPPPADLANVRHVRLQAT